MHQVAAYVFRGAGLESVHHAAVAVVDRNLKLIRQLGDVEFQTQARSEAKPFQVIAMIKSGAADHYGFTARELAIMCGSHVGSDDHVEVVRGILDKVGLDESYLQCGTHQPLHYIVSGRLPRADEQFSPLQHNCSGKHAGFLALARYLDEDPAGYLNPDSRTQKLVLDAVAEMYTYPREKITIGIDGCSAPVFGMPLKQAAIGFARLANGLAIDEDTRNILERIKKAMSLHPEMVSGEGRFDLALARTFPGNIVNKIGAEGIEGIGFSDPPLGIAIKILDGNARALYPVAVEVLRQLGLLEGVDLKHLEPFVRPEIRNYRKLLVGEIVPEFELK